MRSRKVITEFADKIAIIDPDDPEADPIEGFHVEYRRTVARIRYFEEKVVQLVRERNEDALVWGKVSETETTQTGSGPDGEPVDLRTVARVMGGEISTWYELSFRERRHLLDLTKVYIAAKLDARRLDQERELVDKLDVAIAAIITGLGRNPRDADVRNVVRMALVPVAGAIESGT